MGYCIKSTTLSSASISLITPSLNQAAFLEATIQSILQQNVVNLEYIIIDGGSTDSTVEIIQQYQEELTNWVSEPDKGQYHALNKGFAQTEGEIMGWLNADDLYTPWALQLVVDIFTSLPQVEWLTTLAPLKWDEYGRAVHIHRLEGYSQAGFYRADYLPGARPYALTCIQQESTFWRRSLWERAGGYIEEAYPLAGDFELWARFFQHASLYGVATPLGGFRDHASQKTAQHYQKYLDEACYILNQYGGKVSHPLTAMIKFGLSHCLPPKFRLWASKAGLLHPVPRCVYDEEQWRIETRYV